ncbi:toll/interleukin-1 receptor domain-containing protein [Candidatus Dojkabacteria bacterium]|jgi:hypothetical protein|nr:toll/interleukin-1 receptor domain-containing protein [Candidatus Dojkabacteria bacterium]
MKFYIASRLKNKEFVRKIHNELLKKGHTFTSSWIEEKDILPYEKHKKESEVRANKSIEEINNCDIFVLISDETGAGMYTELGIALQLAKTNNKPKIYVVGRYNERSVFFFLPLIKRVNSFKEVLDDIKSLA